MGLFTFLFVFIITSQVLAFGIAFGSRIWPLHLEPVELHGIDIDRARDVVGAYIESLHDTRFGFPTGVFRVDETESTSTTLAAREVNFSGSSGFRLARFVVVIPAVFAAAVADESAGAALFAFAAGIFVAAFMLVPILFVSILEIVLRVVMRSRITAEFEPVPGDSSSVRVRFTLMGLSAFGARRSLMNGLSRPALPPAFGGAALVTTSETWSSDRLNRVYLGAGSIAALVGVIFVVAGPHGNANAGGSYSSGGYVSTDTTSTDTTATDTTATDTTSTDTTATDTTATDTAATDTTATDTTATDTTATDTTATDTTATGTTPSGTSKSYPFLAGITGRVLVRAAPSLTAPVVGRLVPTGSVAIVCTSQGALVTSHGNTSTVWDKIDRPTGYVSDAYIQTGSTTAVGPDCGSGANGGATTGSASTNGGGGGTGTPAPARIIHRHLQLLNAQSYDAAFALFASDYRSADPGWVADRQAADPVINVKSIGTPIINGSTADVPVDFYARDRNQVAGSDTVCRHFHGTTHMVNEGGAWRYEPSGNQLAKTPDPSGGANCN